MQVKIIIFIYLVVVLAVGIVSAFKIKNQSDFFVAGKKAGLFPVTGSLLATILGGSAILGTIEFSRNTGWPALWFLFSAAFGLLLLVPLSKYVKRFGNYTLPEMLGSFYGKKAEFISSLIIPLAWIGIVAAQIIASAKILSSVGIVEYQTAAVVSGVVFIFYTLVGGQISILKTDLIQAVIILAGIAVLTVFSILQHHDYEIAHFKINRLFNSSFSFYDLLVLILTYSVTFVVGPDIYSRVFCSKNEKTAARSVLLTGLILVPVSFALTWLGIYSAQIDPTGITGFAEHLLPSWAFGLFIAALLSAVMSSADTTLLTSSIILSELSSGDLNRENMLKTTRYFVVATGIASMVIALFVTSIIQALLFALTFFSGAFVVPVLAGLLKLKVNRQLVVTAIVSCGMTALAGKIVHDYFHEQTGNFVIFFSYFLNGFLLFFPFRRKPAI